MKIQTDLQKWVIVLIILVMLLVYPKFSRGNEYEKSELVRLEENLTDKNTILLYEWCYKLKLGCDDPKIKSNEMLEWGKQGLYFRIYGNPFAGALSSFESAIFYNPDNLEAWAGRGYALEMLGRNDEAWLSYEKAGGRNLCSFYPLDDGAHALYELERYDEAIEIYDEWIGTCPENPDPWIDKGNALGEMERYEEALEAYDHAINLNLSDGMLWAFKGAKLMEFKRYEEALDPLDQAVQLLPNEWGLIIIKGDVLQNLTRTEELLELSNQAIDSYPKIGEFWLYKGDSLRDLGRYDEALAAYAKALEMGQSNSSDARININLSDYYASIYRGMGLVFTENGDYQKAVEYFDKALKVNPNLEFVKKERLIPLEYLGNKTSVGPDI